MNNQIFKGRVLFAIDYIKTFLITKISNINLFDKYMDVDGIEDIQVIVNKYLDMLNALYQDIIIGRINQYTTIIIIEKDDELVYYKEEKDDDL